ncbi:hypothetical protein GIB67_035031 [Kingdonia uniflora]|uniref:Uncharacterized protein n=1 Tax=Kingdonia uniflora TaxID=39325 RepID=A0A7J7L1M8_9MAGN|nr:hypothetical protein GIB67_035031 [Kingdonia uniflora]
MEQAGGNNASAMAPVAKWRDDFSRKIQYYLDSSPPHTVGHELEALDGVSLPTKGSDEFKPFIRRLPEFNGLRTNESSLFEALKKIKGELMVLSFISLLLTFGQVYIGRICIPIKAADSMFSCPLRHAEVEDTEEHRWRLLWNDRRFLAAAGATVKKYKTEQRRVEFK